jgi:hypothetical protein
MKEWGFAQLKPGDNLAELHFYSMKKPCGSGEVEFRITVWEYVKPRDPEMSFFAQTDKQTNQKTAPFTPSGWGAHCSTRWRSASRRSTDFRMKVGGGVTGYGATRVRVRKCGKFRSGLFRKTLRI